MGFCLVGLGSAGLAGLGAVTPCGFAACRLHFVLQRHPQNHGLRTRIDGRLPFFGLPGGGFGWLNGVTGESIWKGLAKWPATSWD